jgi:hypothetical protein
MRVTFFLKDHIGNYAGTDGLRATDYILTKK